MDIVKIVELAWKSTIGIANLVLHSEASKRQYRFLIDDIEWSFNKIKYFLKTLGRASQRGEQCQKDLEEVMSSVMTLLLDLVRTRGSKYAADAEAHLSKTDTENDQTQSLLEQQVLSIHSIYESILPRPPSHGYYKHVPKELSFYIWRNAKGIALCQTIAEGLRGVVGRLKDEEEGLKKRRASLATILQKIEVVGSIRPPKKAMSDICAELTMLSSGAEVRKAIWKQIEDDIANLRGDDSLSYLWLWGHPSCGKSILASIITNNVKAELHRNSQTDYDNRSKETVVACFLQAMEDSSDLAVLTNIASQLLEWFRIRGVSEQTLDLVDYDIGGTEPLVTEPLVLSIIADYMNMFSVIIVIDGIKKDSTLFNLLWLDLAKGLKSPYRSKVIFLSGDMLLTSPATQGKHLVSTVGVPRDIVKAKVLRMANNNPILVGHAEAITAAILQAEIHHHLGIFEDFLHQLQALNGFNEVQMFVDILMPENIGILRHKLDKCRKQEQGTLYIAVLFVVTILAGHATETAAYKLAKTLDKCVPKKAEPRDPSSHVPHVSVWDALSGILHRDKPHIRLVCVNSVSFILAFIRGISPTFASDVVGEIMRELPLDPDAMHLLKQMQTVYLEVAEEINQHFNSPAFESACRKTRQLVGV